MDMALGRIQSVIVTKKNHISKYGNISNVPQGLGSTILAGMPKMLDLVPYFEAWGTDPLFWVKKYRVLPQVRIKGGVYMSTHDQQWYVFLQWKCDVIISHSSDDVR